MEKKIIRFEANSGIVICLIIIASTLGVVMVNHDKEKTKKIIELKKIENELCIRHANAN